jgi:gas vesicle protein
MKQQTDSLDSGAVILGVLMGLVVGGVAALFLAPRKGVDTRRQISAVGQDLRDQLEEAVNPPDPLVESLAEGKAAARRRRLELGLGQ